MTIDDNAYDDDHADAADDEFHDDDEYDHEDECLFLMIWIVINEDSWMANQNAERNKYHHHLTPLKHCCCDTDAYLHL